MKPLFLLVCLLATAVCLPAQQLSMDSIFDGLGEERPSNLSWSPDGSALAFLWNDHEGQALWILETTSGGIEPALRLADLQGRIEGFEIDDYHWLPDGSRLIIESGGDLFLAALETGNLVRLTDTEAVESDPKASPDGERVAFVRDQDLFLIELASGDERRLTTGGEAGTLLNGLTDWVYWEELWGRDSTGFWWNNDGTHIAYYQFDETPVREYALVNFQERYPTIEWQRYPKAGEDNPLVRVGVLDLSNGETIWLETGDPVEWYLPRVDWLPSGDLAVQRLARDQDRLELLRCDPAVGGCGTWIEETRPTWVDVSDDYLFLDDGRVIWPSERTGWKQLYLVDAEGAVEQLTHMEGAVSRLIGLESDGSVLYQAYGPPPLGALSRQVFSTSIKTGATERTSPRAGWNSALLAPDGAHRVQMGSSITALPSWVVTKRDGAVIATLPYKAPALNVAALPFREFFTIRDAEGRELPVSIIRPRGFRPGQTYPVIMFHYGGPESQVIQNAWSSRARELWTRMMAERGFAMFSVDNPGSNFFGQQGADALHRRFGEVNLAAQLAGVEYLRSLDWIDADRIGIWGWSGGGSNTLYSVLNAPGTWRAAVSGAPVTDWRLYDTIWTERYLDHPADNPDGYRESSAVTWANQLADALLIVHGTADDNVHPQNSLVMTQALVEAGVPFDQAIYPRQKHGFRGNASRHFYEKMTAYFERELAAEQPAVASDEPPKG